MKPVLILPQLLGNGHKLLEISITEPQKVDISCRRNVYEYRRSIREKFAEYTMDKVVEAGWRIGTVRMAFSTREGNAPAKLKVPGRMLGNPVLTGGPLKDVVVDNVVQNRDYLIAMGWNPETAQPQADTLKKLGIPASAG